MKINDGRRVLNTLGTSWDIKILFSFSDSRELNRIYIDGNETNQKIHGTYYKGDLLT